VCCCLRQHTGKYKREKNYKTFSQSFFTKVLISKARAPPPTITHFDKRRILEESHYFLHLMRNRRKSPRHRSQKSSEMSMRFKSARSGGDRNRQFGQIRVPLNSNEADGSRLRSRFPSHFRLSPKFLVSIAIAA
jgi:hypothetical protein